MTAKFSYCEQIKRLLPIDSSGLVPNVKGHKFVIYKCRLLIDFANSLDTDQARQNIGPDRDPNCLTL